MKKVLLIEDDRWLADSYMHVLAHGGYDVSWAETAETAMRLVEESMPDCIVADVMLGGHTVFSLLHELQSYDDTQSIPVILCSNLTHDALDRERLRQYGVTAVLDKGTLTSDRLSLAIKDAVS